MTTETHTELPNCPLCGSAGHTLLRGFYHTHDPEQASPKQQNAVLCPTCRCRAPLESWDKRAVNSHDALVAALRDLVNAKALSEIRSIVAGWNGEDREDGPYTHRHPSQLGATIKTRCGAVYELDAAMQRARAALSSIGGGKP